MHPIYRRVSQAVLVCVCVSVYLALGGTAAECHCWQVSIPNSPVEGPSSAPLAADAVAAAEAAAAVAAACPKASIKPATVHVKL